jgi:glycosyltransferase involved in cell wall biosynthesis
MANYVIYLFIAYIDWINWNAKKGKIMNVSILMPCLNEAETLALCINKAKLWLKKAKIKGEIVIADNGSTDGSQVIAKKLGARIVTVSEKGYGSALYYGAIASKANWIIMGDSDDSYDFSQLDSFVLALKKGADLVMGNRFLGGIEEDAMPWKNRYIGNPILTFIGRLLFNCPSRDFHCGLRAVNKKAFLKMDLRTSGMEFASEMVIKANLLDMKIVEVPTTLSKDGRNRPPHLRPWRDGWRHLRFMLLFSPRWLFLYPGLLIFILSGLGYSILLTGPLKIGTIEFSFNTLFMFQAGTLIGFLFLIFAVMVRIIGTKEGLLPTHNLIEKLRNSSTLEIGSLSGVAIFIWGLLCTLKVVGQWSDLGFKSFPDISLLRLISLSTFMMLLGSLILLFSLVVGFLSLPTRRNES